MRNLHNAGEIRLTSRKFDRQQNRTISTPVAIISDIHGNLIALDAVLNAIECHKIKQMICLGDIAATGPQPREVIARLKEIGCPVVMGNTDDWLLEPKLKERDNPHMQRIQDMELCSSQQLTSEDHAWPFDDTVHNPPWAEYAIIDTLHGGLNVELHRVPFDVRAFIQITLASGMPHAEWAAGEWTSI